MSVNLSDLFWLFFIVVALQPLLARRMLERARRAHLQRIERKRNSRLILLIHRQEQMALLGFPIFRYIDIDDAEQVIRAIHLTDPEVPIDLVLHTPGGLVLAALQISRAIRDHKGKVTVFVPHYAMSGGTLIALAADEIVMNEFAVLGPVDPQLGQYPAASILRTLERKPIEKVDDETVILADMAGKAVKQLRESVCGLMSGKYPPAKAEELADLLTRGEWTHDYPITCAAARQLGLPVNSNMPEEILQLMDLYPQPTRSHPTVEYLPGPHRWRPLEQQRPPKV
jgi:ClpP class serine protease